MQQNDQASRRAAICRQLGIPNVIKAHELIVEGVTRGVAWLMHFGFQSHHLVDLGYSQQALAKLGYGDDALQRLGFIIAESKTEQKPAGVQLEHLSDPGIKHLLQSGARMADIKRAGYTIHQCRRAGLSAIELAHIGFEIPEICTVCGAAEMRRADYKAQELRNYFSDIELKNAGFSASEMRLSGYGVRDLLRLGFNENHIRTAGFSNSELAREGLTRTVRIPPNQS